MRRKYSAAQTMTAIGLTPTTKTSKQAACISTNGRVRIQSMRSAPAWSASALSERLVSNHCSSARPMRTNGLPDGELTECISAFMDSRIDGGDVRQTCGTRHKPDDRSSGPGLQVTGSRLVALAQCGSSLFQRGNALFQRRMAHEQLLQGARFLAVDAESLEGFRHLARSVCAAQCFERADHGARGGEFRAAGVGAIFAAA